MSSRFHRPRDPGSGILLQARDREVLGAIFAHRYLAARHLQALCFPERSRRVVQARLRKLWEHRYLDRRHLPVVIGDDLAPRHGTGEPLYCIGRAGARALAESLGISPSDIPHTPAANAHGYATLEHHLMVTDLLVAVAAAARDHPELRLVSFERETTLRRALHEWRARTPHGKALVPDGAFTVEYRSTGRRTTFYIEAIRAGIKAGNETLRTKMQEYVALLRSGFFQDAYRHGHIRAVLMLTTSIRRVEILRRLAGELPHGSRLFWFGTRDLVTLEGGEILDAPWTTADGQPISFIAAGRDRPAPTDITHV